MPQPPQAMRVGELRPNQLLHTFGVGAVADLPNLSVMIAGLDEWDLTRAEIVDEPRLLAAVRAELGHQVGTLRTPPYVAENSNDPFGEWTRVGVPVSLFPRWLRCSRGQCNQLAPVESGLFDLIPHAYQPDKIRYVHSCFGNGNKRPVAVPARFLLACERGHLDDFPWLYYAHRGVVPDGDHTLRLQERGTSGDAASIFVQCSCGGIGGRSMAEAIGPMAYMGLPACRGRSFHLQTFEPCGVQTRTLGLGATNSWFAMQLRAFALPKADTEIDQLVAEHWAMLEVLAALPEASAKSIVVNLSCWLELEPYGIDNVLNAIRRKADEGPEKPDTDERDLTTPEWAAFSSSRLYDLPDFTTKREGTPPSHTRDWLKEVVLVTRLREVSALYGFTRIDAPEWDVVATDEDKRVPLSREAPTWVPCADTRGEGIFLRIDEARLAIWEQDPAVIGRSRALRRGHVRWRARRRQGPGGWPGVRYILLHTLAHVLIRQLALESGYGASGIAERIYARSGERPMSGILLYTAAPDSEGTLGGLVSLGRRNRLGALIEQALDAARLCSSDPLCAEHDPTVHGRLYGAACHACLFSAETSCERGNHYLDRTLLVDTVADSKVGFLTR